MLFGIIPALGVALEPADARDTTDVAPAGLAIAGGACGRMHPSSASSVSSRSPADSGARVHGPPGE